MQNTHEVGNIGEVRVMFEALKRGYVVCVPHGHDARYDLIVDMNGTLCRVQVKTTVSDGETATVRCRSIGKKDGQTIAKQYTTADIDWIVVYDVTTDACAFIPSSVLGAGMYEMTLRIKPAKSGQTKNVRWFADFSEWKQLPDSSEAEQSLDKR